MERNARRARSTTAPGPAFPPPARSLAPPEQAVLDGLLLALLGRRRLLVLTGGAGVRPGVAGAAAARAAADGALVLAAVARPGADVEDLIRQGGAAAFAPGAAPEDFETLVATLDERLDFAGSGVLAVEAAHHLSPATLADLMDLSREETAHGRFLQILLSGDGELERTLSRPGLDRAVRDLGVVYRLDGPAPAPRPTATARPPAPLRDEDDGAGPPVPQTAVSEPMVFPTVTPLERGGRSPVGAWITGFVLLAAAGTGLALSLPDGPWKDRVSAAAATATATAGAWMQEAQARVSALWEPVVDENRMVALAVPETPAPPAVAPAPLSPAPLPPTPMAAPVHPTVPAGPPPALPPTAAAPPAALPHAVPPAATAAPTVLPDPPPPVPTADPARLQRLQALEEVARQQMAAKRLTTPPGDNALETVHQMQAEVPDAPAVRELLEAMADTYRRWGLLAERTGNAEDARRFYERGLRVLPGEPTLTGLLRSVEERGARPAAASADQRSDAAALMTAAPPAHRVNGSDYGRLWP
ncbi:hypothetical protein M2352_001039 [Azospirillum fermentarium]|uniref:hypothetical protein n=1 Tax=Azospirillum fermentarium TaxID=1233114 RepID=UPI0022279B55|nr:hypothetical protein [Azospirillum fermentarium]MCW2245448.1 hypothetical protein [Azospirillum fermentarium]